MPTRPFILIAILALAPVPARAAAQASPDGDVAAARALVRDFAAAWHRGDGAAIAALFAPDGDLVIPSGQVISGRARVQAFYSGVLSSPPYAGSSTEAEIVRFRKLAPNVAIGDATWSITGVADGHGGVRPPERGILAAVMVRRGGEWRIAALREQEGATALTPLSTAAGS